MNDWLKQNWKGINISSSLLSLNATLQNIWSLIKKLTIDSSLFFIDRNGKGEKKKEREKLPNFTKDIKGANLITALKILRFWQIFLH